MMRKVRESGTIANRSNPALLEAKRAPDNDGMPQETQ
jgi:hypothetical protein